MQMAADYLRRSLSCLEEAEAAFRREDYPLCVRRSQESLEMAAKSLLRALAIEYPKTHDVSPVLLSVSDKLPEAIRSRVTELSSLISELAAIRGPAMYGYEREGIPASEVVSEGYAREVLEKVRGYVGMISGVLIPVLEEKGFWE
ncbi:MAG: HEPN domain-containing protein [Candidatus Korarchaeota archaeon]|nr:HEPN domain-containing protein [Candidatus Korarchaeota archaeon]